MYFSTVKIIDDNMTIAELIHKRNDFLIFLFITYRPNDLSDSSFRHNKASKFSRIITFNCRSCICFRSEERRVGKECKSLRRTYQYKKKQRERIKDNRQT